jgi:peptidyl-prolyl cis-trans isomerase D
VLDLMRRHARSWLIKVALGGIIIVFIFWYGWSGPTHQSRSYAAKVNDTVISLDYFGTIYNSEQEKLRLRYKGSLPPDLADKLNLKKEVIERLVSQALLVQEAERLGLTVTDEDLATDIRSNPGFNRNGVFDDRIYKEYLNAVKLKPAFYEDMRRQELLAEQVVRLLTDSVKMDPEEIKRFWHFHNDKLALSMLLIKPERDRGKVPPDAATLESYFKKNQAKYEIPQTLNVLYVAFSWRDLQKEISVTDEEARSYFEMHPREFITPERIRASHILLKVPPGASVDASLEVKKKAEAILARIKAGENFQKIAAAESEDRATASKGGDLGFFSKNTLNPELEKAAWQLEVGQVSDPVLTEQGFELVRLDEKKPETQLDFEIAKDSIVKKLREARARKKVSDLAEEFYEKVYRTEDLEGQAKNFGLEVKRVDFLTRNGGLPDVGDDPKIMEEAFQLKTGEVSRMIKSDDSYVLLKLIEKNKERTPGFEEVRSTVEQDYLKEQAIVAAREEAQEVIRSLKAEPDKPDKVSARFGLTWQQLNPVTRTARFIPELGNSPEVNEMLTSVTTEAPLFPDPIPVTGGMAVVKLTNVERAADEQYAKDAVFANWVLEVRRTEFLKGWLQVLESQSKIDIPEKLL